MNVRGSTVPGCDPAPDISSVDPSRVHSTSEPLTAPPGRSPPPGWLDSVCLLHHRQVMNREQGLIVDPAMLRGEAGFARKRLKFLDRVLVRVLRMDAFTRTE